MAASLVVACSAGEAFSAAHIVYQTMEPAANRIIDPWPGVALT